MIILSVKRVLALLKCKWGKCKFEQFEQTFFLHCLFGMVVSSNAVCAQMSNTFWLFVYHMIR